MLTLSNLSSLIFAQKVKIEKEKKKLEELYKQYEEVYRTSSQ
jgi:uncharacterized coiled-coil protein SlyX